MLALSLIPDSDEHIRLTVNGVTIELRCTEIRSWNGKYQKARLAFDAPKSVRIERIETSTGRVVGGPGARPAPESRSLSDGVAEATLACTGADSSAPMPRTDAGETPLVKLGQGTYARATSGRDVARDSALGGLINAIA